VTFFFCMLIKKFRITKEKEFEEFFGKKLKTNGGRNVSTSSFVLKFFPNKLGNPRFAIIISNKIDKRAVVRNKLRRWIREVIRLNLKDIKSNTDCLFVVQKPVLKLEREEFKKEVLGLLKKANLL